MPAEVKMTAGWRPGWTIIARKEFGDHLLSGRFVALIAVLGLAAAGAVFAASSTIRDVAPETQGIPALFLKLFTLADAEQVVPFPLVGFVTFLAPLLGIMFGFDAVIGERTGGTLPRLLSQPVHRDDVITGKFAAGLAVVGVMLTALTSFVAGIGIFRLGISPEPTEVARLLVWVVFGVVYVGFWLALATLTSVVVQRAATSALIAMAVWLAMALFGSLLFGFVADVISPAGTGASPAEQLSHLKAEAIISRISPITLFGEGSSVLLDPSVRTVGVVTFEQIDRAVVSNLTLIQSLLVVWPQLVTMVALTTICFAVAYVSFMRQEVRA